MVYTKDEIIDRMAEVASNASIVIDNIPSDYLGLLVEGALIADFKTEELFETFLLLGLLQGLKHGKNGSSLRVVNLF